MATDSVAWAADALQMLSKESTSQPECIVPDHVAIPNAQEDENKPHILPLENNHLHTVLINNDNLQNSENVNNKITTFKVKKRAKHQDQWKCNIRKKARASGQEYLSSKNTIMRAKHLKETCKHTCKYLCSRRFNEEERQNILQAFWDEDVDYNRKRQFVVSCIDQEPVQRQRSRNGARAGRREVTYIYSLILNGSRTRVCKKFFLNTLDISQKFVDLALQKTTSSGIVKGDSRKGHVPGNKIPEEIRNRIRQHIMKFQTLESDYAKEKSSKRYLPSDLSIMKMYQMYTDECVAANISPAQTGKQWLYREIFTTEFNLSFKKRSIK
ncbi:hypothetical protein PV328_006098 [Microctonus aethiopoides]|uniref:Uncharacterized protein n=1 Tax=Microctonus aethiopoides TaxID=144406 RepID=A0AA39KT70_9HYME|nr:hypothetical protein PV328_006098 [Microctonus aethiopoides]